MQKRRKGEKKAKTENEKLEELKAIQKVDRERIQRMSNMVEQLLLLEKGIFILLKNQL